jgi:glycosyltransferase involved in cell wall biosynthesis
MRARYGLPLTFFLFVGTIEPRKNLPRLIRAWNSISANCGCDLVIAGRAGWKTREYHRAVREVSQSARIHQIGFVPAEDLPALMACATAFVWPSLYEGFGLPPLDAMASGVPVLTSAVSSIPEVVGDAALLVDPEDENAIAKGLLRILRDEKLRDRLVRAGRDRARQLSWESSVTQTVQAYRQAIEMSR